MSVGAVLELFRLSRLVISIDTPFIGLTSNFDKFMSLGPIGKRLALVQLEPQELDPN